MHDELSDFEQNKNVCTTSSLSAEHKDKEALIIKKQLLDAPIEISAAQRRLQGVANANKQFEKSKNSCFTVKDCIFAVRENTLLLHAELLESSHPDRVLEAKAERLKDTISYVETRIKAKEESSSILDQVEVKFSSSGRLNKPFTSADEELKFLNARRYALSPTMIEQLSQYFPMEKEMPRIGSSTNKRIFSDHVTLNPCVLSFNVPLLTNCSTYWLHRL